MGGAREGKEAAAPMLLPPQPAASISKWEIVEFQTVAILATERE